MTSVEVSFTLGLIVGTLLVLVWAALGPAQYVRRRAYRIQLNAIRLELEVAVSKEVVDPTTADFRALWQLVNVTFNWSDGDSFRALQRRIRHEPEAQDEIFETLV